MSRDDSLMNNIDVCLRVNQIPVVNNSDQSLVVDVRLNSESNTLWRRIQDKYYKQGIDDKILKEITG